MENNLTFAVAWLSWRRRQQNALKC